MSDNVYSRMQKCRVALSNLPIKESGNNKFAGYTYVELSDFLPHVTALCHEHGLCPVMSFGLETATLTIINIDNADERIVFESPMSTAELKGCHPIQNLGAVETYLRRYLYVAAFDIVEHDALDRTTGEKEAPKAPPIPRKPEAATNFKFLKLMEEEKKRLGDDTYYALLDPYTHANQIPVKKEMEEIYKRMQVAVAPAKEVENAERD